ncbi:hypothetical protein [Rhodococcus gannanensis]|uniref:Uncharacterized protein n=1 Tax=Rhodococcus gannanensis TaxID=1960308 RepID=A0ABW4P062_9NOCA
MADAAEEVVRRRVDVALAGRIALNELSSEEGVAFNADIADRLAESLRTGNHAADRAADGSTSIVLDENGRLARLSPDGSRTIV